MNANTPEASLIPALILDNLPISIVYVDSTHTIRYLNAAAKSHYAKWGNIVGKSIFECHNETSERRIKKACERMEAGSDDILYSENEERRAYMRSARDADGTFLGYYESIEPK